MTPRLRLVPLRRHRHGYRRASASEVYALLAGMRPGRGTAGAAAPPGPAPETTSPGLSGPDARAAHEAWSRFQSGMAAGG